MRLFSSLMGVKCQVPAYSASLPWGNHDKSCCLCADSSTEATLNTFPFQLLPAPPFQAEQHWVFGVCDGTDTLLRAYSSHIASVLSPSPSRQPHIIHAQTTNTPEKPGFVQDHPETSHWSLQGLWLNLQVCKEIHSPAVSLADYRKERGSLQPLIPEHP